MSDKTPTAVHSDRPDLRALAAAAGELGPEELLAAVRADQVARWRSGERVGVDHYFDAFPALAADPELALVLLLGEYLFRQAEGHEPTVEEYLRRFPAHAAALALQFEVHRALASATASGATAAALTSATATAEFFTPDTREWPVVPGYEIRGELGRGGMGVVYHAWDTELKRAVALKMIRGEAALDANFRARFRGEAEAAARLRHPGIVQIYAIGESAGLPFLAMEFVSGGTLAEHLGGVPRPPREAAALIKALAEAMHAAHAQGVVHRDLKPSNILLAGDEPGPGLPLVARDLSLVTPKITDFGVAKILDTDDSRTRTGMILGTPSYASPEQAAGKSGEVGPATDTYSLGAILYEVLTGRPPFQGATVLETLELVRRAEPVAPRSLLPGLPRDLDSVCLRCLEKEPGRRYATAADLAADLGRFLRREPTRARPVGLVGRLGRWCRRNPALAVAVGAVASAVLLVAAVSSASWYVQAGLAADLSVKKTELEDRNRALADKNREIAEKLRREQRAGALATLDKGLAHCAREEFGFGMVYLARALEQAVETGDADLERVARINLAEWGRLVHAVRGDADDARKIHAAAFSPDGRLFATAGFRFLDGGKTEAATWVWDVRTGRPIGPPLQHKDDPADVAFAPDGNILLVGFTHGPAEVWDLTTRRRVGDVLPVEGVDAVAVCPTGRTLLTCEGKKGCRLWDARTREPMGPALEFPGPLVTSAFTADGTTLLTVARFDPPRRDANSRVELWDVRTCRRKGAPLDHPEALTTVALSPDGKHVLVGPVERGARLLELETWKEGSPVLEHNKPLESVAYDRTGTVLVTVDAGGDVQSWDAGTGVPLGPRRVNVLAARFQATKSVLGPFGEHLVSRFDRQLSGWLPVDGTLWDIAPGKALGSALVHAGEVSGVAFGADGRVFTASGGDGRSEFVLRAWDPVTGRPVGEPLGRDAGARKTFPGPDGRTLLTVQGRVARLWDLRTGAACGEPVSHPNEVQGALFTPDGALAATWCSGQERMVQVRLLETDSGRPRGGPRELGPVRSPNRFVPVKSRQVTHFTPLGVSTGGRSVLVREKMIEHNVDVKQRWWVTEADGPEPSTWQRSGGVSAAAFGSGLRLLIADGRTARLWDAGAEVGKPLSHLGEVTAVALSPDGKLALTGCADGTAQLWDAATGQPHRDPLPHPAAVTVVAFGPEGRVVTVDDDGALRLWDAALARPLGPPLAQAGRIRTWALSPDGRTLLTGGADRTARRWRVAAPLAGGVDRVRVWVEALTGRQMDAGVPRDLDDPAWRDRRRRLESLGGPPL